MTMFESFALSLATNLITILVSDYKKRCEDKTTQENADLLKEIENSKEIETQLAQAIIKGLRDLKDIEQDIHLVLPLANDPNFSANLANLFFEDSATPQSIKQLIEKSVSVSKESGLDLKQFAESLIKSIHNAIAQNTKLHRIKELRFHANITSQVAATKDVTLKLSEESRETCQVILGELKNFGEKLNQYRDSDVQTEYQIKEKIFHNQVDKARKLIDEGQVKTAKRLLKDIRSEVLEQNPSKELLFRIATNIGCCSIRLSEKEEAIREIYLAYQLDPNNPTAISNYSMACLQKGNPEEALTFAAKARERLNNDSIATGNFIQALFALSRESELVELIEKEGWILDDPHCALVIGTLYFERHCYSEASKFFDSGLKASPEEPHLLTGSAHCLIRPIQEKLTGGPILDWKFPDDIKPHLNEAEQLLNRAIVGFSNNEDRRHSAFAHLLRADVRRLLGKKQVAIKDCETAISENPRDETALAVKALIYFNTKNFKEVIATCESINDNEQKVNVLIPWAIAYNADRQPEKAISLLNDYWEKEVFTGVRLEIADNLLWAYSQLRKSAKAEKIIGKLNSDYPKVPEALAAIARYRGQEGKIEESISLLTEALTYGSGSKKDFIAIELANRLYETDDFARAAELYFSSADLESDNDLCRRYLICLYNSGSHTEALKLARKLRGGGKPISVISQIEAYILAEIGDLDTAQSILEQLAESQDRPEMYWLQAAELALRQAKHDDTQRLIKLIKYEKVQLMPQILIKVAQLRTVLGMCDVLKFAYQARRKDYGSPQTHAFYVGLFLSREHSDTSLLEKEVIDEDSSFLLKTGNGQRAYTITVDANLHPEMGEISPAQSRDMNVMGRKKGDCFVLEKDAFDNDVKCEVLDVQSKYVRAFQDTLEKFPALFPSNKTIQMVKGTQESFRDGLKKNLDLKQKAFDNVAQMYGARKLTFGSFAMSLRCEEVELWGMLTSGNYCKFANFSGLKSDAEFESKCAIETDSVLLDLTSILTFEQLGLSDSLSKRYNLYTTQPVIDALVKAHADVSISKPGMSIGKVGDSYIRSESTEDGIIRRKNYFEGILVFLTKHVDVLPVHGILKKERISTELREFLGPISTATLLLADEDKLTMLSEDQMLRALGRNEWNIRSISVLPVLHELETKGLLSPEKCIEANSRLFFMNFSVIPIGADHLMWTFEKLGFKVFDDSKQILTTFHGPQCTFESAIEVLAETTKRLWIQNDILYHIKLEFLNEFLEALGTNRATDQVAKHFKKAINRKLILVPQAAEAISKHVRIWKERRLGLVGIILR